jgi:hypothetical protein
VGWAIGLAAAVIDSQHVYPALAGDPDTPRQPNIVDLPTGSQTAGAPRIWAFGQRVRVGCHILFQTTKKREASSGGSKGNSVSYERTFVDALIHANDRQTRSLLQLVGNGQLILFTERNVFYVSTATLTGAYNLYGSTNTVAISTASTLEPDFTETFSVGDLVMPERFLTLTGAQHPYNNTYFTVHAVTPHSQLPSRVFLAAVEGQTVSAGPATMANGGAFVRSQLTKVQDAIPFDSSTDTFNLQTLGRLRIIVSGVDRCRAYRSTLQLNQRVLIRNAYAQGSSTSLSNFDGVIVNVVGTGTPESTLNFFVEFDDLPGGTTGPLVSQAGKTMIVEVMAGSFVTPAVFDEGYQPQLDFNDGDPAQGQPAVLVDNVGSGATGNYRGQATQAVQDMHISIFGDQLPQSLEAIIDVDNQMTIGQAVEAVLQRGGLLNTEIDVRDVDIAPCLGGFVRGVNSTAQQIQPLMMAHQLVVQERDGSICVASMDNVDVVSIENGSEFSDFGAVVGAAQGGRDKFKSIDKPLQELPTSIGVRHQDPDNVYVTGYQHFGLRHPDGVTHTNEQVVDLSNVVIGRAAARNLASTLLRRAYVNRRRYDMTLPAAYLHLLENDLLTWTDDQGEVHTARILQRDLGADLTVRIVAIREMTDLQVGGSATQAPIANVPQQAGSTAEVFPQIIDAPAAQQDNILVPSLTIGSGVVTGGASTVCTVWESQDSGTYQAVGTTGGSSATGYFFSDLSNQTASEAYGTSTVTERAQSVDVYWLNTGTEVIESCTQADAENGKNWCVLLTPGAAAEIAAFRTVVDNGGNQYTLSNWLRGLRGTTPSGRVAGTSIILLNQSTQGLFRRVFTGPLPSSVSYKVVPAGGALENATAVTLSSPVFRNVLPLPVRYATKAYDSTNAVTRFMIHAGPGTGQSPVHWERAVLAPGTQPPHTMDEPYEGYRINFYRDGGFDTGVVDTVVIEADPSTGSNTLRDRFFDWPDARATFAGYTPGSSETYYIGVQQIGQHGDSPEAQFIV